MPTLKELLPDQPQTARINPPSDEACYHLVIHRWHFADTGEVAPLWSCAKCKMRFHPGTVVAELDREIEELRKSVRCD